MRVSPGGMGKHFFDNAGYGGVLYSKRLSCGAFEGSVTVFPGRNVIAGSSNAQPFGYMLAP